MLLLLIVLRFVEELPQEQITRFAQGEEYQGWFSVEDGFLVYEGANFHDMFAKSMELIKEEERVRVQGRWYEAALEEERRRDWEIGQYDLPDRTDTTEL